MWMASNLFVLISVIGEPPIAANGINLIGTSNPRKYLTCAIIFRRSGISTKKISFLRSTSIFQKFKTFTFLSHCWPPPTTDSRLDSERVKSFDIFYCYVSCWFFFSWPVLEYRKNAIRAEYEKKEETASTLIASNPLKYYFFLSLSRSRSLNLLRMIFIIGSHPDKSD